MADAEARAAVLDEAAARFKEVGLDDRAKAFEEEAALIRKKETQAPPPGRRLDMAVGFVERAERRASEADDAVKAAEEALAEAAAARDVAYKEVEEGKSKLAELRAGLANETPAEAATADAEAIAVGAQAADALARARSAVEGPECAPLTLAVFRLPEALGTAIFAARPAPALDAPLDPSTAFFVQDALQSRVREAALAGARAAAAAAAPAGPAAPAELPRTSG